jgi:hypothetical protein
MIGEVCIPLNKLPDLYYPEVNNLLTFSPFVEYGRLLSNTCSLWHLCLRYMHELPSIPDKILASLSKLWIYGYMSQTNHRRIISLCQNLEELTLLAGSWRVPHDSEELLRYFETFFNILPKTLKVLKIIDSESLNFTAITLHRSLEDQAFPSLERLAIGMEGGVDGTFSCDLSDTCKVQGV